MHESQEAIKARYQTALDMFIGKVKQDSYIIAAILAGSLSHDQVWEKSDIDMLLVGRNEKIPEREYSLIENGIHIHAWLLSRSRFKQQIERALQSSFFHSYFSKSTLLFSTDETISEYYQNIQRLGARDRELQLLRAGAWALTILAKAEKWLYVKNDPAYSFLWLMYMINSLATIEVLQHSEIAGREVVQQAMKHNPAFFGAIYFDMPRTAGELDRYFVKQTQTESLCPAYEWLAAKGTIQCISTPLRLTEKSRVTVDEATYYYDDERPTTNDQR